MIRSWIVGLLMGVLVCWLALGLQIIPTTIWHWSFFGEPIELEGQIAAPILIRMPSGSYYYIYEYEKHGDIWYLYDYIEHFDGHWGNRVTGYPLTLGMNESYEIIMMPSYYKFEGEVY